MTLTMPDDGETLFVTGSLSLLWSAKERAFYITLDSYILRFDNYFAAIKVYGQLEEQQGVTNG
ncbi:MAG TPA: hypothetical protein VHT73_11950 [Thermodesulfobacteriota bacterium]|nr:hypothetical protein [Thermodesulfobacteriota bacterium]